MLFLYPFLGGEIVIAIEPLRVSEFSPGVKFLTVLAMSSLESIHNDRLKVGIISHVESIKNRVHRKLIVTPAKAGKGESKVKIEVS